MEAKQTSGARGGFDLIVQLATVASILAGIYLVMVELRQAREISTVQMIHTRLVANVEHDSRIFGENLAVTLAKACHSPEDLDDSEVIALNYFFLTRMRQVYIVYTGATLGTYQHGIGIVENWRQLGAGYIRDILSYPSGRRWIKEHPYYNNVANAENDEVVGLLQSLSDTSPMLDCSEMRDALTPSV